MTIKAKITIAIATIFMLCHSRVSLPQAATVNCAYCPCNYRLYTTAALCQTECRGTLACLASCIGVQVPGNYVPTQAQDKEQREAFPKLQCYSMIQRPTLNYNCIASAVGINNEWIWDKVDSYGNSNGRVEVSDFDNFFASFGFAPSTNCGFTTGVDKIALYGHPSPPPGTGFEPTHAARQVTGGLFESKEGRDKKIRHGAGDLGGGGTYGELIKCYEK